jgi:hypothetical protein
MLALTGCSLAVLNEPINFAIACRPDTALEMTSRSASSDGVLESVLGEVAELAILKDAGRTTAYRKARDELLAKHDSMSQAQVEEAVDTKVTEMRQAREKATGKATC